MLRLVSLICIIANDKHIMYYNLYIKLNIAQRTHLIKLICIHIHTYTYTCISPYAYIHRYTHIYTYIHIFKACPRPPYLRVAGFQTACGQDAETQEHTLLKRGTAHSVCRYLATCARGLAPCHDHRLNENFH